MSVFLICLLFSYYIYAEYDRNRSEQVSKEILAQVKYQIDDTVKQTEDDVIVVILDTEEEKHHFELLERSYIEARYNDKFVVPKEVVDALVPKVDLLFNIVEDVCRKQFDYYKQKIAQ